MASYFVRPGSSFFYLKVKRKGGWVQVPTSVRHGEPGALRKIKREVARESAKELATTQTQRGWDWVPAFLRDSYTDKTRVRYANAWSALLVWFEVHHIFGPGEVSRKLLLAYPSWRVNVPRVLMRPCKWNTALTELRVLSAVLKEAMVRELIAHNPCAALGLKRRDVKQKPEITAAQQAVIEAELGKAETPDWMRKSWMVAMAQGVRLSETCVPLANVDLAARPGLPLGTLWTQGKGGRIHTAPLHPAVRRLVEVALAEGRTVLFEFPKAPAKVWWKFFRRLKLDLSFHSTRVSVVTRIVRQGFAKSQTMTYVGHASQTVHDVYTRLGAADVAHLAGALPVGELSPGKSGGSAGASRGPTGR
ncbi:MAG TPA: tyrosine-type recombinase/integrase [Chthoniobacter sp.]|jgi:site-specific recombinase XerD